MEAPVIDDEGMGFFPEDKDVLALQVDGSLSPLECLARYGRSPIFEQCSAFVNSSAAAARESSCEDIVRIILPLLADMQAHAEEALRLAALRQLPGVGAAYLARGGTPGGPEWLQALDALSPALAGPPSEEWDAAAEAFAGALPLLSDAQQRSSVANLVSILAGGPEGEQRASAARLTECLCGGGLPAALAEEALLPVLLQLATDADVSVRQAVGGALGGILAVLSRHLSDSQVAPALARLAGDRVWSARQAVARALPQLAAAACRQHCPLALQLLAALLGDASAWVRGAALLAAGPVLCSAEGLPVSTELVAAYMSGACSGASSQAPLAVSCASCFPAILLALGAPRWPELQAGFEALTRHSSGGVREAAAAALPQLAATLKGFPAAPGLLASLQVSCRDASPGVQEAVLGGSRVLLEAQPEQARPLVLDLLLGVLRGERAPACTSWRGRLAFAEQGGACAALLSQQDVLSALLPALLELCRDPVAAVRLASGGQLGGAAASLCQSAAPSEDASADSSVAAAAAQICLLASSPAFQYRQVYAHAFAYMAGAMHARTVLRHFWPAFASLAADPVSNVRLTVARTLVSLVRVPIIDGYTRTDPSCEDTAAVFAVQLPMLELALELGKDSDREIARLARTSILL